MSYTLNPFLGGKTDPFDIRHTCDWECWQIARTFQELGFGVDVISYTDHDFLPQKDYAFLIDELTNLERLAPLLNRDCVKILHIVWSHWLFHNNAQYNRIVELQSRRGTILKPRRLLTPNLAIEHADCATMLGNEFTLSTYRYAGKPVYPLSISTPVLYPWWDDKDFDNCRRHFLWFGSGGLVHKGLDLALDAFAQLPDYRLTVCGPVHEEEDFAKLYRRELSKTSNIRTIGWLDIRSTEFRELLKSCVGLIYPSCSEGQSGGVVTCLHGGLIPVVSCQSGVDVRDFGFLLTESTVGEIKESIQRVADLPTQELRQRSRSAWEFARFRHTRDHFSREYRKVGVSILESEWKKPAPAATLTCG